MDSFQFDELSELEMPRATQKTRSKPLKRKWREIEAINDRRQLEKELREMNLGLDFSLDDIKL
ncbi:MULTISPECIES: DUF3545 family protein [Vibrio]|jgi:hypothetical protein|uniref:DUF3545 domain-containing protein n=1 Tax=Vibrio splendidus TaxID=29497 RepID=A0A0P6ZHL1_VIBSP|nr:MULTISPECIES: DUF3545 family protein [Vibrio]HAS24344.1 DUF3545 domain-containing protein [Vibrio sp.]EAP93042.1 hypothetical protein V12B01_08622 [Vibrio splendidus 12B01]KPL93176.1 hypothetical protein AN168_16610 [Vibrio splendidus]KPL98317.1 hypothetical protein AN167_18535 [Vibrio splendidus]MBB1461948.1 DUF3545 family protein [Vibrio sp. SG41-7]|tara:strand:+ start:398 stop:586 length:189 start_codon:yes stop_codon:yes gene_type:complete